MSDPEKFLQRWARRKQEAAQNAPAEPNEPLMDVPANAPNPDGLPFDPASLPSLESITADSDIRGFFAPGVPPELTRAALRRVWVTDPKIRDFVGLADYDWDFNAANAAAGFGPLELTDDLRRQVVQMVSGNFPTRLQSKDHVAVQSGPVACVKASPAEVTAAHVDEASAKEPDGSSGPCDRPPEA